MNRSRRARKTQNAEVRAVGSPRAPRDRRGIYTGRRGISEDTMPRCALWACTKCVPWLGVSTAIWISAVRTPWIRSGNAVTALWGFLERYEDAVRTQLGRIWPEQERRCSRWRLHGDPTECMETLMRLYRVLTARLRRVHSYDLQQKMAHKPL